VQDFQKRLDMGLLPITIFEAIFPVLFKTSSKKVRKYGVLINCCWQVLGKTGEIGRKLVLGSSPDIGYLEMVLLPKPF